MRVFSVVRAVPWLVAWCFMAAGRGADAPGTTPEPVVTLPAFVVEEARLEPKWQYVSHRDFEILADCPAGVAMAVARQLPSCLQIIDDLVPPELRLRLNAPFTIVLDGSPPVRPGSGRQSAKAPARGRPLVVSQQGHTDQDVFTAYLSVSRDAPDGVGTRFASMVAFTHYISAMLDNATPPTRPWLLAATKRLLSSMMVYGTRLEVRDVPRPGLSSRPPPLMMPLDQAFELLDRPFALEIRARRLLAGQEMARAQYTVGLLVHWAWFAEDEKYRERFWEYYRRAGAVPEADEALFKECFGLDYAEAFAQLNAYRNKSMETATYTYDYKAVLPPSPPASAIRKARPEEIARITGEWSRLAGLAEPRNEDVLRVAATRIFERGLQEPGQADGRLAGAAGIFFAETGSDERALPYLRQAERDGLPRARVYLELARIELAREKGDARKGKLAPVQVQKVMKLLDHAYTYSTQEEQYYDLLAEAWERSEAKPQLHELTHLRQAAWLFPRKSALIARIAQLHAAHGFVTEARALGRTGLAFATGREARSALVELAGEEQP